MSIRDAARAAWVAARSGREDEARTYLAGLLEPFDVASLTTIDVDVTDAYVLFVLLDEGDDVHLAVRDSGQGWQAFVVADTGGWTVQGVPIRSLAHLWELLPPAPDEPEPDPDPEYPVWYQRHAPDAWSEGDRVIWPEGSGQVWEATAGGQGGNTWEPGSYGWEKVG